MIGNRSDFCISDWQIKLEIEAYRLTSQSIFCFIHTALTLDLHLDEKKVLLVI